MSSEKSRTNSSEREWLVNLFDQRAEKINSNALKTVAANSHVIYPTVKDTAMSIVDKLSSQLATEPHYQTIFRTPLQLDGLATFAKRTLNCFNRVVESETMNILTDSQIVKSLLQVSGSNSFVYCSLLTFTHQSITLITHNDIRKRFSHSHKSDEVTTPKSFTLSSQKSKTSRKKIVRSDPRIRLTISPRRSE